MYLYREQGWDTDETNGQPVLFIPGNAGSYQQVRSIGSLLARQAPGSHDVYTGESMEEGSMMILVDFREDGVTPYATVWKYGLEEYKV